MRNATRDRRFVRCPKASTLAYGKWRAQVGDFVVYTYPDGGPTETGRMISRIVYAAGFDTVTDVRNWIEVLTLNQELTHAYVRWVNPDWVSRVYAAAPDTARFLAWYAGPLPADDVIRGMAEYGTLSANQQADYPHWDFAGKLKSYQEYVDRAGRQYSEK
jgi:hypothetical protein